MATRTVTGTIKHADGSAWAGLVVSFQLIDSLIVGDDTIPTETHDETTDANGDFSTALTVPATGTAHYKVILPDGSHEFYLAAGASVDLSTLITLASSAVDQDAVQTLLDSHVATDHASMYYPQANSTAIQAAIDAASTAGGGIVLLPVGTITLDASLTPRRGVTVRGVYPGGTSSQPNYWNPDTVDTGTVITYPGGVAFQQDLTGGLGVASALDGFVLESCGFNDCATIFACGGLNRDGLSGGIIRDIIASNITGIAFDLQNFQNCHFSNFRVSCVQFLVLSSNHDKSVGTTNDLQPGNSYFDDMYCMILPGGQALPSIHLRCIGTAGQETNLNLCHFSRVQTNRLALPLKTGYHVLMEGASAYAGINCHTFESLDLEGAAEYHIYGEWVNSTRIHMALMTEDNYTVKFRNTAQMTIENNNAMYVDLDSSNLTFTLLGSMTKVVGGGLYPLGTYITTNTDNNRAALHATPSLTNVLYQDPAYTNTGGTGDRTALITVTTNFTVGGGGALSQLVDGAKTDATNVWFAPVDVTGKWFKFQFGAAVLITEAKYWYSYPSYAQGFFDTEAWIWQGSQNNVNWEDIGLQGPMGDYANPRVLSGLSSNRTGYVYYRVIGVAGTMTGYDVPQEWEFKIGNLL